LETHWENTQYPEGNRLSRRRSLISKGELQGGGRGGHPQQSVIKEEVA